VILCMWYAQLELLQLWLHIQDIMIIAFACKYINSYKINIKATGRKRLIYTTNWNSRTLIGHLALQSFVTQPWAQLLVIFYCIWVVSIVNKIIILKCIVDTSLIYSIATYMVLKSYCIFGCTHRSWRHSQQNILVDIANGLTKSP